MTTEDKVRENKARRTLARRGYVLVKSRRRDPHAFDFGGYIITDQYNRVVTGTDPVAFSLTLDDVYDFIEEETTSRSS